MKGKLMQQTNKKMALRQVLVYIVFNVILVKVLVLKQFQKAIYT